MNIFAAIPDLVTAACHWFTNNQFFNLPQVNFILFLSYIPEKNGFICSELSFIKRMIYENLKTCKFVPCYDANSVITFSLPCFTVMVNNSNWFLKLYKYFQNDPTNNFYIGATIEEICYENGFFLLDPSINHLILMKNTCTIVHIKDVLIELGCQIFNIKMVFHFLKKKINMLNVRDYSKILVVYGLLIDLIQVDIISSHSIHSISNDNTWMDELNEMKMIPLENGDMITLKDTTMPIYYNSCAMFLLVKDSNDDSVLLIHEIKKKIFETFNQYAVNKNIHIKFLNSLFLMDLCKLGYTTIQIENLLNNILGFKSIDIFILIKQYIVPDIEKINISTTFFIQHSTLLDMYYDSLMCIFIMWKQKSLSNSFINWFKNTYPMVCFENSVENVKLSTLASKNIYDGRLCNMITFHDCTYLCNKYYDTQRWNFDEFMLFLQYFGLKIIYQPDTIIHWIDIINNGSIEQRSKLLKYMDNNWTCISLWLDSKEYLDNAILDRLLIDIKLCKWIPNKECGTSYPNHMITDNQYSSIFTHSSLYKYMTNIKLENKSFIKKLGIKSKLTLNYCVFILNEFSKDNNNIPTLDIYTFIYMIMASKIIKKSLKITFNPNQPLIYIPNNGGGFMETNLSQSTHGKMFCADQVYYQDNIFNSYLSLKRYYYHTDLKKLFINHFQVRKKPNDYTNIFIIYMNSITFTNYDIKLVKKCLYKFFKFYTYKLAKTSYLQYSLFHQLFTNIPIIKDNRLDDIISKNEELFYKILQIEYNPNIHLRFIVDDFYFEKYQCFFKHVTFVYLNSDEEKLALADHTIPWKQYKRLYAKLFLLKQLNFNLLSNTIEIDCIDNDQNLIQSSTTDILMVTLKNIYNQIISHIQNNNYIIKEKISQMKLFYKVSSPSVPFIKVKLKNCMVEIQNKICYLENSTNFVWIFNLHQLQMNLFNIQKNMTIFEDIIYEYGKLFYKSYPNYNWSIILVNVMKKITLDFNNISNISLKNDPSSLYNETKSTNTNVEFDNNDKNHSQLLVSSYHDYDTISERVDIPKIFSLDTANQFTDRVGYIGEQYFYNYILEQSHFNNNEIVDVEWMNIKNESFLPYDFMITVKMNDNKQCNYYVEVKSTCVFNKNHFFLSINELVFAINNEKNFFICRVLVDMKNPEASCLTSILQDIPNCINNKDYKLILAY